MQESTIAAISTAAGNGGIGIVRMSGKEVFTILEKIFVPAKYIDEYKKNRKTIKLGQVNGYTMKYGYVINPKSGEIIDEVLISFFVAPKSFTKENMCEINTHGGMIVEKKILEICIEAGADIAKPGEFTQRAFLNGRIDLSQAEAIVDLINAKSDKEAKEAANQLEGSLSKEITTIEQELLNAIINIEVVIDYPEYDIEEVQGTDSRKELLSTLEKLEKLKESFKRGKLLKDGVNTVILGRPNAGKSSLLNAILNEDRAIVSNIEGTTRDTIEEYINLNGISLKLIDTAGIREASNEIEKIGVEKSTQMAEKADLILAVFDGSKPLNSEDREILNIIKNKKAIILLNKSDIESDKKAKIDDNEHVTVEISAKTGDGLEGLYKEIENMFEVENIYNDNNILITNERHKNQIVKAIENVKLAIKSIEDNVPIDISTIYIKEALENLGEITGKNVTEDIINQIFKKFCLGK